MSEPNGSLAITSIQLLRYNSLDDADSINMVYATIQFNFLPIFVALANLFFTTQW